MEISFNGEAVTHDVSFSLREGEILGIVGESGSGKSSLLKAAVGLLGADGLVTRGDIFFDGKNLPDLSEREMRKICGAKIGMIFQGAKIFSLPRSYNRISNPRKYVCAYENIKDRVKGSRTRNV